jgi:hypothetical protein
MSVVMYEVTPRRKVDGTNASTTQRTRQRTASFAIDPSPIDGLGMGAARRRVAAIESATVHANMTYPQRHARACRDNPSHGSTMTG